MDSPTSSPHPLDNAPPGWPPWFKRFFLPYMQEPGLFVVWLILLAHVVMVFAAVLLFALREQHPAGAVGLVFLLLATAEAARLERSWHHKFGMLTLTAFGCWVAAGGLAVAASWAGVL